MSDSGDKRRGVTPDVELGAALALADMAGTSAVQARPQTADDDGEMETASTSLSLRLGSVGVRSPSCSSSSGAAAAAAPGAAHHHGPSRPRHMLTEAEKEAKRLRRVLANRESARQTILRRQAVRDELARKVADLSSQNETIRKEKDVVTKEYLSLKQTNEQLKAQAHHLSLSLC